MNKPRGIRLNNPGNIKRNHIKWQGMSDIQPDPVFCSFRSPEYGIRAMVKILMTYNGRGIDTIREIVSSWAPKFENPLENYINFVSDKTLTKPDEPLDIENPHDIIPVLKAIVHFENGQQPYEPNVYTKAYFMAKGEEPWKELSSLSQAQHLESGSWLSRLLSRLRRLLRP